MPVAEGEIPVVCAGMVVADHLCPPIDHLPRAGELVPSEDLVLNIGGGAANTAVDLSRLGVRVSICARVGEDIFGRYTREMLVREGVDVRGLKSDPVAATSQTLIVNVRGEDRRFIHAIGANRDFRASDLDEMLTPGLRLLHIGYFLIMPNLLGSELATRLAACRRAGTFTMLDVATPGEGRYRGPLEEVLPHTDLFVPNRDEAELILGVSDPIEQARTFRRMGARRVVITQGESGVISLSEEHEVRVGSYPVTYLDGTGGGDAFNAGYIVGVLEGRGELECLKLASVVGASCVRAVGTTAGVFTRKEAEDFLNEHEVAVEPLGS